MRLTPVRPTNQNKETRMDHSTLVSKLVKPGEQIKSEVTANDCNLLHMVVGVCGEAGELLDAVKKATIYRKPLDRENVIEEMGDLEFYLEGIRQELGITRDECLRSNISKLMVRYNGKYSNHAAQARADKE